ncbi:serine hydrolase [Streptomyces virginiae]|uniref:D-alanyl-D-alanine carboxypeptidase family protein n=1 Tax=Streptomyces virginiae TaxID=1961 RepID=UPI0036FEC079
MKAVTVTGGSSDDPKIEGTTVAGADPDDTSTEPDTEDQAGPAEADGAGARNDEPVPEAGPEPDSDEPAGTDSKDATPEASEATRVLKMPAITAPTPDDGGEGADDTSAPAEAPTGPEAGTPEPEAEAEAPEPTAEPGEPEGTDTAPESDATRVLKMPARTTAAPDDAHTETPTGPKSPAIEPKDTADAPSDTDAEDEATEASDATHVLKVPARTTSAPTPNDDVAEADDTSPSAEAPTGPAAGTAESEADAEAPDPTAEAGEPQGTDAEDEAPEASDATRVLKMPAPAGTATTPDDGVEGADDTSAPAEAPTGTEAGTAGPEADADAAGEPEGTDAEDEAPEASDATRVLKMPARTTAAPDDAHTETPTGPKSPATEPKDTADAPSDTDAEDEALEASDATRVLKVPAPASTEPRATADVPSGPESPVAKAKASRTGTSRTAGKDGESGGRADEDKGDKAAGGAAQERSAAEKAAWPRLKADADASRDGAGPGAGRSAGQGTAGDDGAGPRVPGWARVAKDEDSERTSQFVALKDLDVPPPVPARPQPQASAPAPARAATAPPLPPLDLLAELTNTPHPPQTPRRTALRRVKVWTPILLLLVGACIGGQMLRPLPAPRLVAAETDHTVDGQFSIPWPANGQGAVRVSGSGDIGTFGDQKPVPTASVAKIMTAYVILKGHPLRKNEPGPDITVDAKTVADGNSEHESRITGLTVGSKFSQQDMLKMLMIPSGNNVARLLARWDTGTDTEAAFVEKMNAAARELGMKDTTYTDPSGLDAGTVSTATDQLKLAEAVMKDEAFRVIVALPEAPIKGLGEKLVNNNDLLTVQGLSIRGIKTGSSTPAGGTFVWAAYKSVGDETPLIVGSLMEQRAPAPDKDALNSLALVKANSKKIIEAVRTALASTPLVRKGDVVGYVDDGLGGRTPLVAVKDLNVISVPGQRFELSLNAGASPLPHTAKDGTEVGVLTAGEGEGAKSVPVAVKGALGEPSFGTRLTRLG